MISKYLRTEELKAAVYNAVKNGAPLEVIGVTVEKENVRVVFEVDLLNQRIGRIEVNGSAMVARTTRHGMRQQILALKKLGTTSEIAKKLKGAYGVVPLSTLHTYLNDLVNQGYVTRSVPEGSKKRIVWSFQEKA